MERKKLKKLSKEEESSNRKKKIIVAVIILTIAFSGSFIIFFILQVSLGTKSPMVVVISGSMAPNINRGDLLFIENNTDPEDIKAGTIKDKSGDVIVYDADGLWDSGAPDEPIVHRVVDKWYNETEKMWYFLTKGDHNPSVDKAPVPADHIIGVSCGRIPYIGYVKIFLTESGLFIPLLIILSVLLVISIIYDIIKEEEEEEEEDEKIKKVKITRKKTTKPEKKIEIKEDQRSIERKKDDFDF